MHFVRWRISLGSIFILLVLLGAPESFAQTTRPVSGVIAATTAPVSISFTQADGASIGRQGNTGDPIYLNDEISTSADSNLQILLKDQTVFTIGPDSTIIFDEFIYDPADASSASLSATVTQGAFKFISGKVSKTNPNAMTLNLPNATAAIRGTSVAGVVKKDGSSDVLLLSGAIAVSTDVNPEPIDIFTSGWGMNISASGFANDPIQLDTDQVNQIISAVEFALASSEEDEGGPQTEAEQAASDTPLSREDVQEVIESATTLGEVVTAVSLAFADAEGGSIDAADLGRLLLENENLLIASNIDPDLISAENNQGVNVDLQLVQYALSGGEPKWMSVLYQNGQNVLGNQNITGDYTGLISSVYAGSTSFSKSGLVLSSAPDSNGSGSAVADYTLTVNYDSLTLNGSLSVYDVVLGGRSYDDNMNNSFSQDISAGLNSSIYKNAYFEPTSPISNTLGVSGHEDENSNGILNMNEEFEEVQTTSFSLNGSDANYDAQVRMDASLGSISDGVSAIDGQLGGVHIRIEEVNVSGTPYYTDNAVNATHYSKGTAQ